MDPTILPSVLAQLLQQPSQSPTQGNVIPPTSPFDYAQMVNQVSSLPAFQKPTASLEATQGKMADVQNQMGSMPIPKTGWLDTQGQPQQGGFLHSLLRGLTAVAAATRPGQAVEEAVYQPGINRYNTKQRVLTEQLAALKDQETAPTEELKAVGNMASGAGMAAYRSGTLQNKEENTAINKQRADTAAKMAANRSADMLVKESQGWKNLDIKTQSNNIRAAFDREIANVARERIAAGQDENSARIQATEDVKAAASQNQYSVLHPFLSMLGVTPDLTSAPGAGTPKPIQAKPSQKGGGPSTGKKGVFNPTTGQVEWK